MYNTRYYIGLTTKHGEPVNAERQAELVKMAADYHGGGLTVYTTVGYWQGVRELSMVLEALNGECIAPEPIARMLAFHAEQSSVLWTQEYVKGGLTS